jgi:hypothetical protein
VASAKRSRRARYTTRSHCSLYLNDECRRCSYVLEGKGVAYICLRVNIIGSCTILEFGLYGVLYKVSLMARNSFKFIVNLSTPCSFCSIANEFFIHLLSFVLQEADGRSNLPKSTKRAVFWDRCFHLGRLGFRGR